MLSDNWLISFYRYKRDIRYDNERDVSDGESNLEYVLFVALVDEVAKRRIFLRSLNLQEKRETVINRLTPNDPYMGRTAPLTSKLCILYIYSTNIGTEYFKYAL